MDRPIKVPNRFGKGVYGHNDIGHSLSETGASLLRCAIFTVHVCYLSTKMSNHMCYSHHISPGCRKRCATLVPQLTNMPRINGVTSDLVQSAVAFSIKCPNATIPQCMLACGFSKQEANDWAKRMAIYRHLKKVGKPKQEDTNEYVTPPTWRLMCRSSTSRGHCHL
jgi:hypothetical protein